MGNREQMIKLFHIPTHKINTARFSNLLHDEIVHVFEENFCKYVGIPYGCATNSASNIIFLLALHHTSYFKVPSIIPPVVLNSIINAKREFAYTDNIGWVGHSYNLTEDGKIIDSAQEVERNFGSVLRDNDIVFFSFYPTKTVGGCDGGIICSKNEKIVEMYRTLAYNGIVGQNSWDGEIQVAGWKMYMNSIQAYIANENLKRLDDKKKKLDVISSIYNHEFGYGNNSHHLYRIRVRDNTEFLKYMKSNDITCGIHYRCLHNKPVYFQPVTLPKSELEEKQTVSIPFHEKLTDTEILHVIKCIKSTQLLLPN